MNTHTHTQRRVLSDLEVLSIEGQRAADQRVEDHSQAPDVHLGPVVLLALEELWSCIGRGAAESVQLVPQSEFITEAKVCYLDVHVRVQQQVLCLQTRGVCGGERERENERTYLWCTEREDVEGDRKTNTEEKRKHLLCVLW